MGKANLPIPLTVSSTDDVAAHWLGLIHSDGWIPREQILGAEISRLHRLRSSSTDNVYR